MTVQPYKRLLFRWTTTKNLLNILTFITLTAIIQCIIITQTIRLGIRDPTATTIPLFNITISLLYHVLPAAVIMTLTTSFTYLTTHIATIRQKSQPARIHRQKFTHGKAKRKFYKRFQRSARKIKNKILKTPTIANIQHRISLAKTIIKSATSIILVFTIIIILITIAAYPKLIPTITASFYQWNTAFLNFVAETIKASEVIANAIAPIGGIAVAIHRALIAAAPIFYSTLEATASNITNSLVALNHIEKYLIIQNTAAWTVAFTTLLYCKYIRTRRYRR